MVKDVYDDPSQVSAVEGEVTLMGPGASRRSILRTPPRFSAGSTETNGEWLR